MAGDKQLAIFVFIDAFGWELLQRHSFLDDTLVCKARLDTIFGYSSTCDPTILTGLMPQDHGHFSSFYFAPHESPFRACKYLKYLPASITRRGRVRRLISRSVAGAYGYTGYFQLYNMPFDRLPLFGYAERRDLYQPGGINGGQATIIDVWRDRGIRFSLSDWRRSEVENLSRLRKDIEGGEIEAAYLYLAAMDAVLHAKGTAAAEVTDKIAWYETQLRTVLKTANEHYGEVSLTIFSDHGMTDVIKVSDLMPRIEKLGLNFGVDYAAVYDSTMARFWFMHDDARLRISSALHAEPDGKILTEDELRAFGCDFPDHKYGDLFFVMDPGVVICPSFMGETRLAGMHGYDPAHEDSAAIFASTHPPAVLPKRLDDLYRVMGEATADRQPVLAGGAP